ncbi:MAG: DUF87 domain-containing protein, partial [Betaproteobacteria bacterium]|nr:DUF87 domain-containing protein [Betaproteobacteria bacterium]
FAPAGRTDIDRLNGYWAAAGVLLFIISSAALENIRFAHNSDFMPSGAGGGVGKLVAGDMLRLFGHTGASVLLLCIWIISWSLAANLSWFSFFELTGEKIETILAWGIARWRRHRDARRGRRASMQRANAAEDARRAEKLQLEPYTAIRKKPKIPEAVKPKPAAAPTLVPVPQKLRPENDSRPETLPSAALLDAYGDSDAGVSEEILARNSAKIEETLGSFGVAVKVLSAHPGPVITRYDIRPDSGVKGAQIVSLVRDIARALSVAGIRILETIPGKNCMGLEIPNQNRAAVYFSDLVADDSYAGGGHALPLALGKDATGKPLTVDLAKMPHLLVAGATGSGKSVCVNAMLLSLLFSASPEKLRLILIDPKMLELSSYHGIPHLLAPVVTDVMLAPTALNWAVEEMENRYRLISVTGARNIDSYNEKIAGQGANAPPPLPYIVIVIDELADLMMTTGKKVEITISRLAQKARAAGIHLILATQRPSVDVITGLIKANVPARIAFQVASKVDSRTIIDQMGADMLLGMGDMLYLPAGAPTPIRVHGSFVSDEEVRRVADHLRAGRKSDYVVDFSQTPPPAPGNGGEEEDELYRQAVEAVMSANRPSISLVQRKLRIGYNRAARLVESMEQAGLITPADETGTRKIIAR